MTSNDEFIDASWLSSKYLRRLWRRGSYQIWVFGVGLKCCVFLSFWLHVTHVDHLCDVDRGAKCKCCKLSSSKPPAENSLIQNIFSDPFDHFWHKNTAASGRLIEGWAAPRWRDFRQFIWISNFWLNEKFIAYRGREGKILWINKFLNPNSLEKCLLHAMLCMTLIRTIIRPILVIYKWTSLR